jgi:hypothetical protein
MVPPRAEILHPVRALCTAFASGSASTAELLTHFTSKPLPLAHEYGHPVLAPFLGRMFTGLVAVGEYFDLLASTLSYANMTFDAEDDWTVDAQTFTVCLRGKATFTWKSTGESWDETFTWRLGLAEDLSGEAAADGNEGLKIQEYRVWADTGAAYLASQGKLRELAGGKQRKNSTQTPAAAKKQNELPARDALGSGMNVYGSCG